MKTLDTVFDALEKLKSDVSSLNSALLQHERKIASTQHRDSDHAELYGFVHRLSRLLGDLLPILNEPVPAIR